MLTFTKTSRLFARATSRTSSPRRKARAHLGLESLEGRELMSNITGPPVPAPPPPRTVPPVFINPPNTTPPTRV
jgi:hypothetical protein